MFGSSFAPFVRSSDTPWRHSDLRSRQSGGAAWCGRRRVATKRVLHALLPTTATVDTPAHRQAPLHKSHEQLPQTRLQSLLNLPAMMKCLSPLHTMTHMQRAVENVDIGMPLLVNADAERKFVAVGTVSRAGFHGGGRL